MTTSIHGRRTPCEDMGRDQERPSTTKVNPRLQANHQTFEESQNTESSSQPSEGTNFADILSSNL